MAEYDKEARELRNAGVSRNAIAEKLGLTLRQVRSSLERSSRDPAVAGGMAKIGTDMVPAAMWVKTDTHSILLRPEQSGEQDIVERMVEAFQDIPAYVPVESEFDYSDLLTVYPLYDVHAGMLSWGRETRGPDYDLDLFKGDLINSVERLSFRTPASNHALVIFGGDVFHMNDATNETPGHKHKLDVDGRFEKVVDVAIEAICNTIELLAQRHAKVSVVVIRGNHCESSHLFLKIALKQRYRDSERIQFPVIPGADKSEIFWIQHGQTMIAAHHGDKMKPEKLAMIVADQCGFWSNTKHRAILTGHLHHTRVMDMPGVTHYTLRAFAPADQYGSNFGGVRGLQAMTFCPKHGLIAQVHDGVWRDEG